MPPTPAQLDATFAALADPTRRAILARLAEGEASVIELAEPFAMSQPAISKHLKVLERAGLISRGRDAQRRPCRIEAAPLEEATGWLERYRQIWEAQLPAARRPARRAAARKEARPSNPRHNRRGTDGTTPCRFATPSDREVVITRAFDAPRELVFDCHTKPDLVRRWLLGPPGWTMPVCDIDLRVGGRYRYVWRGPDGEELGMGGIYRLIERPERIDTRELFDEDWTGGETFIATASSPSRTAGRLSR